MDYISIILLLVSAANIFYGTFVFNRNRDSASARNFFFLTLVMTVWGASMFLLREATDVMLATIYTKLLYTSAALIPLFAVFFAFQFPDTKNRLSKNAILTILAPVPFVLWLVWQPNMLISEVVIKGLSLTHEPSVAFNTVQHILYTLYVSAYFLLAHIFLFKTQKTHTRAVSRQVSYMMVGTISTIAISSVTNILLPFFGDFSLNWIGPTATTIMFFAVSYSIYRHRAFNLRVQFSEILAILLVSVAITDLLTSIYYIDSILLFAWKFTMAIIIAWVAKSFLDGLFAEQTSKKKLKKLNKRLKEMDEKKTEFLHIATHQLRGPVASINGYASLMRDGDYGKLAKAQVEPLQKILASSKIMTDTINDYMDIARIEEKNLTLEPEDFKLCKLVKERVEILQVSAEEKGIKLVVEIPTGKPCTVHADKKNITQAVNALLENAIKYTIKGTVTVQAERSEDGTRAIVHISDSGIGVPKGELEGLFTKFSRASNAEESSVGGTGMGLFIAKSLMEANGGTIAVSSEGLNKGTTFTIELPLLV